MKTGNGVCGVAGEKGGLKGYVHVKKGKVKTGVCGAVAGGGYAHARKEKVKTGVCGAVAGRGYAHARKEKATSSPKLL